jgi:putative membrane protein
MKYKKVMAGVMSAALSLSMAVPVGAAQKADGVVKSETVYVKGDKSGNVKETIVSDWLQNIAESDKIEDTSTLNQIENVKGEETFTKGKHGAINWNAKGKDIYYQGTTDEEIPIQLGVTYWLDGKKINPAKLKGKSGKLKVRIQADNSEDTPFTVLSLMTLPSDQCRNISVSNGKVLADGKNEIVAGITMPGLTKQLDIDQFDNKDLSSVTINCEVQDFDAVSIYNVAMNGLLNDIDLNDSDALTDMLDTLKSSSKQLVKGSRQVSSGMNSLSAKAKEYTDGVQKYINGVNTYKDGVAKVSRGLKELASGSTDLVSGTDSVASGAQTIDSSVGQLASSMQQLQSGAGQVSAGITALDSKLAQAQSSLAAKASELESKKSQVQGLIEKQTALMNSTEDEQVKAVLQASVSTEQELLSELSSSAQTMTNTLSSIRAYTGEGGSLRNGSQAVAGGIKTATEGACRIKEGTKTLASGAKAVSSGANSLSSGIQSAKDGSGKLEQAGGTLTKGGNQLASASGQLNSGISKLQNGSLNLRKGMAKFDREGITKGTDLADGLFDKMDDVIKKDAEYENFSGISKGMEGEVKFIIELE